MMKTIRSCTAFLCGSVVSLIAAEPLTNSLRMKLVPIPAGTFAMGQDGPAADYNGKVHAAKFDDADWDEKPVHQVTISAPFHLGATEVTLGQYRQFRGKHAGDRGAADDAVTGVSWDDAVRFCEWLSGKEKRTYRLPTEAEWEHACRAGTTTLFHTGNTLPGGFHQWPADIGLRDRFFPGGTLPPEVRAKSEKLTLRVAQTPANAWGLFDMHGNVSEWCADWYGPYEAAAQVDPLGRSAGDFRVIRGGSHSQQTRLLRSANRTAWLPETSSEKTGFRVVLGALPAGRMLPPAAPALPARNVSQALPKIEKARQAKFGFKTPASFSCDGGLTWTHEPTEFPAISSVQRQVLMRLQEGPLLFCSFTDLPANARKPTGLDFPCAGGTLHGAGLFAALSFDDGKTWPHRRLVTPGEKERTVNGIERGQFTLSATSAEPQGYLAATQTRDGRIQLISSKNHYVFNLAWLQTLPPAPQP